MIIEVELTPDVVQALDLFIAESKGKPLSRSEAAAMALSAWADETSVLAWDDEDDAC